MVGEFFELTSNQARTISGIGGSLMQSMVNKLVDMGRARRTSVDDITDVIACLIACTKELLGIFSIAGELPELEELKQRLEVGDRDGDTADSVVRTDNNSDSSEETNAIKEAIGRLGCLLADVICDRIEAEEEGWPGADEKYDNLETKIRAEMKAAEDLLRRCEEVKRESRS